MSWWEGVVLGLVQGLTEFLPVSSSGHLVVTQAAIGLEIPGVFVEVVLHVATLLAVALVYRKRLWALLHGGIRGERTAWVFIGLLVVGSIPAAAAGLYLKDFFERTFDALAIVGVDFLLTGAILWSTRWANPGARTEPRVSGAVGIGLAQAFAILPGISRSGATVSAGLWLGVAPVAAAEFSFLLAMPAIGGAALLQVPALSSEAMVVGVVPLTISFIVALAAGVWAIRFLVHLLARGAFHRFAPYCWAIGAVTLVWAAIR